MTRRLDAVAKQSRRGDADAIHATNIDMRQMVRLHLMRA